VLKLAKQLYPRVKLSIRTNTNVKSAEAKAEATARSQAIRDRDAAIGVRLREIGGTDRSHLRALSQAVLTWNRANFGGDAPTENAMIDAATLAKELVALHDERAQLHQESRTLSSILLNYRYSVIEDSWANIIRDQADTLEELRDRIQRQLDARKSGAP